MVRWLPLALLAATLGACQGEPCPYGSMLNSDGGLLVTKAEHPTGWGQADCTECHAIPELHRQGCTPGVDLAAVREVVQTDGVASCMGCHGENGTAP